MRGRASEDTNHSMIAQSEKSDDPMIWSCLLALAFGAACSIRLATPASPYFDEVHYIPAAKAWLENGAWLNREHPPLGKYIIAAGIALFGDNALGWRIFSVVAGVVTLFAAMRAIWYASLSRFAVISCWPFLQSLCGRSAGRSVSRNRDGEGWPSRGSRLACRWDPNGTWRWPQCCPVSHS